MAPIDCLGGLVRVILMKTMQAAVARRRFDKLIDDVAVAPIRIQRHGRDVAVMMSIEDYERCFKRTTDQDLVARYHDESMERYGALYERLGGN